MRPPSALVLALSLLALLPFDAVHAAPLRVVFSAVSDQFGADPFSAGARVAGEFFFDPAAPQLGGAACPTGSTCLDGAVSGGQFTVGTLPFTATDLDVYLTPLDVSGGLLLSVKVPAARTGQVSGVVPARGLELVDLEFEARFASSFFPGRLPELDLTSDFTLLVARFLFAPIGSSGPITTFTLGQSEFTSLTVTAVPAPAAGWCLLGASSALAALRRRAAG
jgi:hypothetical protein